MEEIDMGKILEVKNLRKSYDQTEILKGINLSVYEGDFVVIMGRSGSGKSTLLYNMSGMDQVTSGEVYLEGKEISKLTDDEMSNVRLKKMGFVFQQSQMLKKLSIKDNIVLPGYKAKEKTQDEVNRYAEKLMKQVGIEKIGDHDIKRVSGGQLQRAAICRALINQPQVLFGDEPTGALNSNATMEIMEIMREINKQGTTIVMVTHDAKVVAWAKRIIYIADGEIEAELKIEEDNENHHLKQREEKVNKWLNSLGF